MYVTRRDERLPRHFNMSIDEAAHDSPAPGAGLAWIREGFDESSIRRATVIGQSCAPPRKWVGWLPHRTERCHARHANDCSSRHRISRGRAVDPTSATWARASCVPSMRQAGGRRQAGARTSGGCVIDRHSKGGARAAKNGFSAMDFVETVPFAPDEGAGTASAMPPEKEASSLFFDDLSVAGPTRAHRTRAHVVEAATGTRTIRSPGDSVPHPAADPGAPAAPRPGGRTPSGEMGTPARRSASISIARSDTAGHPRSTTPSHPRSPPAAADPGRLPGLPEPGAPTTRQAAPPARRALAMPPRSMMILAAVTAAVSIVLLVRAATRSGQAQPQVTPATAAATSEASRSHDEEPSRTGSATAAQPNIDALPVARPMPVAAAPRAPEAPALIGDGASGRTSGASSGPREDQAGPRPSSTPAVQRRLGATREAIAASVAAAQSKADAFLRSEGPVSGKPPSGSGAP